MQVYAFKPSATRMTGIYHLLKMGVKKINGIGHVYYQIALEIT